jgi:hypothetical protein
LLVDTAQASSCPVGAVLVVDEAVTLAAGLVLLVGSMILASTSCLKTSSPPAALSKPSALYALDSASHRCPIREPTISNGPPEDVAASKLNPRSNSSCLSAIRWAAAASSA